MKSITKKIVLLGNEGVGKTSLVKQFVHSIFNDEYLTTIGIKISKKTVTLGDVEVNLMLWDIAGNMMSKMLYQNYLKGAHGIFLVCDGTRPATYEAILEEKNNHLSTDFKDSHTFVIINKSDLMSQDDLDRIATLEYDYLTSAKEGNNVDEAFTAMAKYLVSS